MSKDKEEKKVVNKNIDDKMRAEALKILRQSVKKKYGDAALLTVETKEEMPKEWIGTGCLSLDLALEYPFPLGRIVEIYGPESNGKSSTGITVLAEAQKKFPTKRVAIVDAEFSLDAQYAEKLGLDLSKCDVIQPASGEEGLDIVEMLVRSGLYSAILVDSVAALTPAAEHEKTMGDSVMGKHALLMSQAMRKLVGPVHDANVCLIFTNQLRMKFVMFGNPEVTSGGNALKYYTTQRIDLRRTEYLKDDKDVPYGIRVKAKCVKNKIAPPMREAEFTIVFGEGIDKDLDLLDKAVELGVVEKATGAHYSYKTEKLGHGPDQATTFLYEHKDIARKIKEEVLKVLKR